MVAATFDSVLACLPRSPCDSFSLSPLAALVPVSATAPDTRPLARAVGESYSDSLLAAAPLAASPHPERKSLLVEAPALLGGDIPGMQSFFEAVFRLGYGLDRGNSAIERTRTGREGISLTFRNHYAVPKLPPPPVFTPGGPPPNPALMPNPPRALPDARSFFVSLAYTLAPLPAEPMKTRRADQRVGFFTNAYTDFGNEFEGDRRSHLAQRWRLEKQELVSSEWGASDNNRKAKFYSITRKGKAKLGEQIEAWDRLVDAMGMVLGKKVSA